MAGSPRIIGGAIETEDKYIEEIEVRFEAIERETVILLRKFSQKFPPAVTAKTTGTVPKNEGSVVTDGQSSSSNNPLISSTNLEVPHSNVDQPSVETILYCIVRFIYSSEQ